MLYSVNLFFSVISYFYLALTYNFRNSSRRNILIMIDIIVHYMRESVVDTSMKLNTFVYKESLLDRSPDVHKSFLEFTS